MQVSSPSWIEANLLADLTRWDHADEPAEAARDIWILMAPASFGDGRTSGSSRRTTFPEQ
jgi:hypothetical protein